MNKTHISVSFYYKNHYKNHHLRNWLIKLQNYANLMQKNIVKLLKLQHLYEKKNIQND